MIDTVEGSRRRLWGFVALGLLLPGTFLASLALGSVGLSPAELWAALWGEGEAVSRMIFWEIRLPKAITASLAGAALAMAGLQMQTIFRNPLADPFVLGVNSGASLGVALIVLALGPSALSFLASLGATGNYAIVLASTLGAGGVLALVMLLATRVDLMTLLIVGLMIGYAASALVSILMFFAIPEQLQAFFAWTYGNFGNVTWGELGAFTPAVMAGVVMVLFSGKVMNALLLGEDYARSLGVRLGFWRFWVLLSASLLAGTVTGFCGPIGFIGVAVPHLCRALLGTADHRVLLPAVLLMGAVAALLADLTSQVPGSRLVLPLNAITALIGAPVVIFFLLKRRTLQQSFGA